MLFEDLLISPRILRVSEETVINGKFVDLPRGIKSGAVLKLKYAPVSGLLDNNTKFGCSEEKEVACTFSPDGTFSYSFTGNAEGEYVFHLYMELDSNVIHLAKFSCYALEEDLFKLRPYKGDTHVHR